jgi:hypothetical protein
MERYKIYMDRILVSPELHERLRKPEKEKKRWQRRGYQAFAGAAVVCLALFVLIWPDLTKRSGGMTTVENGAAAGGSAGTVTVGDEGAVPEMAETEELAWETFLPMISGEEFSGWQTGETEDESVYEAVGSWNQGRQSVSVKIMRTDGGGADVSKGVSPETGFQNSIKVENGIARAEFYTEGCLIEYRFEGMTEEEILALLKTVEGLQEK